MAENHPPNCPMNLLSEIEFCHEWAQQHSVLEQLAAQNPLVPLKHLSMRTVLYRAAGYLAQNSGLVNIWSLDDLVAPEAFKAIVTNAAAQSVSSAQSIALVLLIIARDWAEVDRFHYATLTSIASNLPSASFERRRVYTTPAGAYRPSLRRSNPRPVMQGFA